MASVSSSTTTVCKAKQEPNNKVLVGYLLKHTTLNKDIISLVCVYSGSLAEHVFSIDEIGLRIFQNLDAIDIMRARFGSKTLKQLANSPSLALQRTTHESGQKVTQIGLCNLGGPIDVIMYERGQGMSKRTQITHFNQEFTLLI